MLSVLFEPTCEFLRIKISFVDNSKVYINMRDYLHKVINSFREKDLKLVTILTTSKIRLINKDLHPLSNEKAK